MLRLVAAKSAEDMRDHIEFLSDWGRMNSVFDSLSLIEQHGALRALHDHQSARQRAATHWQ